MDSVWRWLRGWLAPHRTRYSRWNVKYWGVMGDERTDDTVALQRAFDHRAGIMPPGTYLTSHTLRLRSGLHVRGIARKRWWIELLFNRPPRLAPRILFRPVGPDAQAIIEVPRDVRGASVTGLHLEGPPQMFRAFQVGFEFFDGEADNGEDA